MNELDVDYLITSGSVKDITHLPRSTGFKDRIGTRCNKLTIVSLYKVIQYSSQKVKVFWKCRCDCGNFCLKVNDHLNRKRIGTCGLGCPLKKQRTVDKETHYNSCINSARARYKCDAKKRNYDFNLSKEEFKNLVESPCYFCNKKETQHVKYKEFVFKFGGIDRLDNTIGYSLDNCIPCCKRCNTLKNGITLDMVKKLYSLMVEKGLI